MLSNGFARPLCLQRKRSLLLASYLIVIHLLGLIALFQPMQISSFVLGLVLVLLAISAAYHFRYYRLQCDDALYWIWHANASWQYGEPTQTWQLALSKSVQTPWFVTLTLVSPQQQRRVLIVRDQVDADTFRRLRVRLKLHHEDAAAAGSDEPV